MERKKWKKETSAHPMEENSAPKLHIGGIRDRYKLFKKHWNKFLGSFRPAQMLDSGQTPRNVRKVSALRYLIRIYVIFLKSKMYLDSCTVQV